MASFKPYGIYYCPVLCPYCLLCYPFTGVTDMEYDAYEIGNRAYNARHNMNIKQSEISEALGIHQATYSKFENGRYDMPLSEVIKLCNYLGVSVSWLIGEKSLPRLTDSERLEVEKFINYTISIRNSKK